MDKTVELSIIIVDYKSKSYLFDCLKSIRKNLKNINYEIIIVDNNQEPEFRIKNYELSKILLNTPHSIIPTINNGFGASNNLGAKSAKGEYLLLLNPDTLLIDSSINGMYNFIIQHPEIGALTCLLYNDIYCKKMQKNFFGKFQSLASVTIRRYNYKKTNLVHEKFFYTDIVTGACLMIKRELFQKLGGFDENIFMYLEDDDLCRRLVKLGYKNAVLNIAKIIHLEGQSSNNKQKKQYYYKSQDYYWKKHNGLLPTLLMRLIRFPYKLFKENK